MKVNQEDLQRVIADLRSCDVLSIDTETTGLDRQDRPFAVIIANAEQVFYFDERCSGPDMWNFLNAIGPHEWALQNAKFDIKMCNRMGLNIRGTVYDIATGSRLLRNDPLKHSLDAQAERYLQRRKSDEVTKYIKEHNLYEDRLNFFGESTKQPRYDWVPLEIMAEYAELDARLTYDLHQYYKANLDSESMELYKMEADLVPVCLQMEEHGLLLDKEYTLAAMYAEQYELERHKAEYHVAHGTLFVNSAKSVQKHLTIELPQTDKGNPSLDDDVIDWVIANGNPNDIKTAETVRSIRGYEKRISTYYKSYLNFMSDQGLIHPTMWQAGTRTGRFSYSDPNLQNIPKEEDSTNRYVVRGCFKPRSDRKFVSFDYSQMEYRMMAAYANAKDLIEAVMNGADFHQATADLLGIKRKDAKTLNFALLYGAGEDKIASMLGCSKQEAKQLKFKYFSNLPTIERFIDNVIKTGKSRGFVKSWCGRRMYADKEFCYALPNHLIQGGGADVVKKAMVKIHEELPFIPMVVQIHDQLIFEMLDEDHMYINRIKQIMEGIFPAMNGMVLKVDVSMSYGSLAERDMVKIQ